MADFQFPVFNSERFLHVNPCLLSSLSTHEDASSQFAKREKIAAPLVKAIGTFFAAMGLRGVQARVGILCAAGHVIVPAAARF